jgi:type II secretory pathway pseudopilin PulG
MKTIFTITTTVFCLISASAQKQQKENKEAVEESRKLILGKQDQVALRKEDPSESKDILYSNSNSKGKTNEDVIWEGTKDHDGGGPKFSKNQPAKVRSSFNKEFPNATAVTWSKYRGDWTASFKNGLFYSTAVYNANGNRKDTRTVVSRADVPKGVLDGIYKRKPGISVGEIVKVETTEALHQIFRIKTIENGKINFLLLNSNGNEVAYNY